MLFFLYTTPVSSIMNKYHSISHHLNADDTQVSIPLTPKYDSVTILELQGFLQKNQLWIDKNMLELNLDKTEFIVLNRSKVQRVFFPINILDNLFTASNKVKNLGVLFNSSLSFSDHTHTGALLQIMELAFA